MFMDYRKKGRKRKRGREKERGREKAGGERNIDWLPL